MMGDLFHARRSDPPPLQHVGQEWSDVLQPLRAAERDEQHGVEPLDSLRSLAAGLIVHVDRII
jgi:hypothetical protein